MAPGGTTHTRPVGSRYARWARSRLHLVLGVAGPVIGLVAAVAAYTAGATLTAAFVMFVLVAGTLALALPDALVGPRRVAPVAFGLLPVVASLAGVLIAANYWDVGWIELIVGAIIGSSIGSALQPMVFPALARERTERWGARRDETARQR